MQAVAALTHEGNRPIIHDCIVELLQFERERILQIENFFQPLDCQLKKFVKRCNDIKFVYEEPVKNNSISSLTNYSDDTFLKIPQYSITAYEHSGISIIPQFLHVIN